MSTLTADSPTFRYPSLRQFFLVSVAVHGLLLLGMLLERMPEPPAEHATTVQVKLKAAPPPEKPVPPPVVTALEPAQAPPPIALAPQMLASSVAGESQQLPAVTSEKPIDSSAKEKKKAVTASASQDTRKHQKKETSVAAAPKAPPVKKEAKPTEIAEKSVTNATAQRSQKKGLFMAQGADKMDQAVEQQAISASQKHLNAVAEQFTEENFQRILKHWRSPGRFAEYYEGVIQIQSTPGGMIRRIGIIKPSGSEALDRSVIEAVKRTRFMKMPNDVIVQNSAFTSVQLTYDSTM